MLAILDCSTGTSRLDKSSELRGLSRAGPLDVSSGRAHWQIKVRRTITCFQRSLRDVGSGKFHIGADHGFANLGRYLRHEL
jgi:hypothetical protein